MKIDVCQIWSRKLLTQKLLQIFISKIGEIILFSWNLFDASVWRSGTYIAIDINR